MKSLLFTMLITFSFNSFATCGEDFNNGFNEYDFAARYFKIGTDSYNNAVRLSRSSNPNFLKICNILVDSVSGFTVAKTSYSNCESDFNSAITSCSGNDSAQASENKVVCQGNFEISRDNEEVIRKLLKNTCFIGSKENMKLELVDLFETDTL